MRGFYRVDLKDEATRIGSGRRTVFVDRVGPRWVPIRDPYTLRTARLPRADWNAIQATAKPIMQPRNLKPAVTRLLKTTRRKRTKAVRAMLKHRGKVSP